MPVLRLFASAREAAGVARAELEGATVDELLAAASARYGERFTAVLARSRVWVNGEPATGDTPVTGHDVVAVLPPVSGGAGDTAVLEKPPPHGESAAAAPPAAPAPLPVAAPEPEPEARESEPEPEAREPAPEPEPEARESEPPSPVAAAPAPTPAAPLPVAAPASLPDPVPPATPEAALTPLPVAAPPSTPVPAPPAPPPARASSPAPPAEPATSTPAKPAPPPSVPSPPTRPAPAPPPMAGLGGAPIPSPPATAPRDPPIPPPPPVPRAPRPGEIGGAAISRPPPAGGSAAAPVVAPRPPPETVPRPAPPAGPPVPEPATEEGKERAEQAGWSLARFAVVYDVDRPHGRIGLVWAAVTVAAVFGGKVPLAAWLGVAAVVGASQTAAARRALEQRPPPWLAALAAAGLPVAAVFSGMHLVGAVAAGLAAALLARTLVPDEAAARDLSVALLIGVTTGMAAASVVATRELGMNPTFFLLACAAVYDVGAYLIGTGAGAHWEGPVAGMVGIMPVAILASILLVPPFPGGAPILLGALAVVLAPLGPLVATAFAGDRELDVPGLRRLDSLILLGPMWAWAATRFLA